jgi:hypothetical protein
MIRKDLKEGEGNSRIKPMILWMDIIEVALPRSPLRIYARLGQRYLHIAQMFL